MWERGREARSLGDGILVHLEQNFNAGTRLISPTGHRGSPKLGPWFQLGFIPGIESNGERSSEAEFSLSASLTHAVC